MSQRTTRALVRGIVLGQLAARLQYERRDRYEHVGVHDEGERQWLSLQAERWGYAIPVGTAWSQEFRKSSRTIALLESRRATFRPT